MSSLKLLPKDVGYSACHHSSYYQKTLEHAASLQVLDDSCDQIEDELIHCIPLMTCTIFIAVMTCTTLHPLHSIHLRMYSSNIRWARHYVFRSITLMTCTIFTTSITLLSLQSLRLPLHHIDDMHYIHYVQYITVITVITSSGASHWWHALCSLRPLHYCHYSHYVFRCITLMTCTIFATSITLLSLQSLHLPELQPDCNERACSLV